jgi:hypothetical protein
MSNPTQSILTVSRRHRSYKRGYLEHYGKRLGEFLYSQARRNAADWLRRMPKVLRHNMYFRFDSIMSAAPTLVIG